MKNKFVTNVRFVGRFRDFVHLPAESRRGSSVTFRVT